MQLIVFFICVDFKQSPWSRSEHSAKDPGSEETGWVGRGGQAACTQTARVSELRGGSGSEKVWTGDKTAAGDLKPPKTTWIQGWLGSRYPLLSNNSPNPLALGVCLPRLKRGPWNLRSLWLKMKRRDGERWRSTRLHGTRTSRSRGR